ncbi:MAG: archaeal proteasome endopeptidase complex subunit beta [Candidatus Aenigmarchaeota archaeon]|nr:archaeal proteasome endopeptidase complex subunit beta [Candidatus Aenigmarchaeota archaeon]
MKETGTTTLGIVCRDCLVLATESKSTMGYLVASKTAQKIYEIDDKIAITTAGGVGDTQSIVRMMKAEIALYKTTRRSEFTVRAAAALLSNILQSSRYYPLMAMLLVGGHDSSGFHLYSVDPLGGSEPDNYSSTGSGSPFAYGVLENEYRENMSRDDAVRAAIKAVHAARERDIGSGGEIVVAIITKDGIGHLSRSEIDNIYKSVRSGN